LQQGEDLAIDMIEGNRLHNLCVFHYLFIFIMLCFKLR
jgi:hypothetical protein